MTWLIDNFLSINFAQFHTTRLRDCRTDVSDTQAEQHMERDNAVSKEFSGKNCLPENSFGHSWNLNCLFYIVDCLLAHQVHSLIKNGSSSIIREDTQHIFSERGARGGTHLPCKRTCRASTFLPIWIFTRSIGSFSRDKEVMSRSSWLLLRDDI